MSYPVPAGSFPLTQAQQPAWPPPSRSGGVNDPPTIKQSASSFQSMLSLVNVNILGILFPSHLPARAPCLSFLSLFLVLSRYRGAQPAPSILDDSQEFSISLHSFDLFLIIAFVGHFPHGRCDRSHQNVSI